MLIAISGKIGSGKDTLAEMLRFIIASPNPLSYDDYRYAEGGWDKIHGRNIHIMKWAGILKDMVCLMIRCTREQLEDREFKDTPLGKEWQNGSHFSNVMTPRILMQLLGTEVGRSIHLNTWVNALLNQYKPLPVTAKQFKGWGTENLKVEPEYPTWIISDTRFPNEVQAVQERGGIMIRIERYPEEIRIEDHKPIPFNPSSDVHMEVYNAGLKNSHLSETALDNYLFFDYTVDNNSTLEDLYNNALKIISQFKLQENGTNDNRTATNR